jgi:hypothetical protein
MGLPNACGTDLPQRDDVPAPPAIRDITLTVLTWHRRTQASIGGRSGDCRGGRTFVNVRLESIGPTVASLQGQSAQPPAFKPSSSRCWLAPAPSLPA